VEVVQEDHDLVSTEPTLMLALSRAGTRSAFLFGFGVSHNGFGRGHLAYGFKLGEVAVLTLGAAVGPVKRLSTTIDHGLNPAGVDPELSRRDVIRAAPFIGVSFHLGNG